MAVTTLSPYTAPGDMLDVKEICGLLKDTGHPVSPTTVHRWIGLYEFPVERCGPKRSVHVSFSDILMAHQEAVARRQR